MKIIKSAIILGLLLISAGWPEIKDLSYDGKKITFTLTEPDFVFVEVCSPDGQHKATVFAGQQQVGQKSILWDRKDDYGRVLPAGEYVVFVCAGKSAVWDRKFGENGFVQFINPTCLRVDKKGDLYVVDLTSKGPAVGTGSGQLKKISPEGKPVADFFRWYGAKPDEQKVDFLNLPRFTVWVEISDNGTFLYNDGNTIAVRELTRGKILYNFGGFEWTLDENRKFKPKPGSVWPLYGVAIGDGNKVYIRDQHAIRVYDRTKQGLDGYLYSSPEELDYPPVEGVYIGPCIAADKMGRIYVTGINGLSRFTDTGTGIKKEYDAEMKFKECMGVAIGPDGMIYVADRGLGLEDKVVAETKKGVAKQTPRIYQFWDDGKTLRPVWFLEDNEIFGLHDVAISPKGEAIYIIEDSDNFGIRGNNLPGIEKKWPQRSLQGKARLFKYIISYRQKEQKTIQIPQDK